MAQLRFPPSFVTGPRGPKGDKGEMGQQGPPGTGGFQPSGTVFVERYMADAGNDLRTAFINALADKPTGYRFEFPTGRFNWTGDGITEAQGLRSNLWIQGVGTEIYRDVAGLPTGQIIFFLAVNAGMTNVHWRGIKFSLLNCITSFGGYAIGAEQPTKWTIRDCEFFCTLDPSITAGKGHWGVFLGGGSDNQITDCVTTQSQLAMGGAGRSATNMICSRIVARQANDLVISVVCDGAGPSGGFTNNVIISDILCEDTAGQGVVFVGADGGLNPMANSRNILIHDIIMGGARNPDLPRAPTAVTYTGALVTKNVHIHDVVVQQTGMAIPGQAVLVTGQDSETSFEGLTISDIDSDALATAGDSNYQVYVSLQQAKHVKISNIFCRGQRGLQFINCDNMTINNVITDNGTLSITGTRDLDRINISNVQLNNTALFSPGLDFGASNKNMTRVKIANSTLTGTSFGLRTSLGGGSMDMALADVRLEPTGVLTETLTGVKLATNCIGLT